MRLENAHDYIHKFKAIFKDGSVVKFGAYNFNDYTTYYGRDPIVANTKKALYLSRHKPREDWSDPKTPGALSRWILWNRPTIESSLSDFKRRFPGV